MYYRWLIHTVVHAITFFEFLVGPRCWDESRYPCQLYSSWIRADAFCWFSNKKCCHCMHSLLPYWGFESASSSHLVHSLPSRLDNKQCYCLTCMLGEGIWSLSHTCLTFRLTIVQFIALPCGSRFLSSNFIFHLLPRVHVRSSKWKHWLSSRISLKHEFSHEIKSYSFCDDDLNNCLCNRITLKHDSSWSSSCSSFLMQVGATLFVVSIYFGIYLKKRVLVFSI